MIAAAEIEPVYPLTDGDIAVQNLESTQMQAWGRFWRDPLRPGAAESVVSQEQLTLQFLSDLAALDRVETLVSFLEHVDDASPRTALIHAQVASMAHRFAEARDRLAGASGSEELTDAAHRLSLSIDQACGERLDAVLAARMRLARDSGRLEDLVPLGALYADLGECEEAERIYERAFREYSDTSPFAIAWVCFQLGVLRGEVAPVPQASRAIAWYERAVQYLPRYVKARVHLSELYLQEERLQEAEAMLMPALSSGDPEVNWRLADAWTRMGKDAEAETQMQAALTGFETLLKKHPLAFADHGAEFFSGSGNDARRAFELASINLSNRSTARAFELAHETALGAGLTDVAADILARSERTHEASSHEH